MANTDMRRRLAMMLEGSPVTIKGVPPLTTIKRRLLSLKAFGGTEQNGTPTPNTPVDIVCNNGVLKAKHQSGLPLGYTLLDYIESTGTQYINTGARITADFKVLLDLYIPNQISKETDLIRGVSTASNFSILGYSSRTLASVVGGDPINGGIGYILATRGVIGLSTHGKKEMGSETWTTLERSYSGNDTLRLFGNAAYRLYGIEIYDGDTIVRDFVPAKNASNVIGMYDLVSDQFFTNAGTGDFVAGNKVTDPIEIYADGTVETIEVTGKNLFNEATMKSTNPMAIVNDYLWWSYIPSDKAVAIKVPVKPNTTYTLSYTGGNRCFIGGFTNDVLLNSSEAIRCDFSIFAGSSSAVSPKTFTTPSNCNFICCGLSNGATGAGVTNIQFELGSTATTYEPYYNGGTATAEMLLKVGDYKDVQSVIDGVITRNVGVKVLDGTEGWLYYSSIPGLFYSENTISNNKIGAGAFELMSNQYIATDSSTLEYNYSMRFQLKSAADRTVASHRLYVRNTNYTTVGDWQQHLADQYAAGTPVIVVYPLATPTTETVAGQTLVLTSSNSGTNVVDITQASLNNLELEVKAK